MRILITGHLGYVGSPLIEHLRATFPDAHLIGVDRGWFAHCITTKRQLAECLLDEQWFKDVRDLDEKDLCGVDAVVHLAAISNDAMGKRFETVTDEINHRASVRLAEISARAGVRAFVFASSCSVYGAAADGQPRTERSGIDPLTAYARSKVDTEAGLQALGSNIVVTCLRFATACGMSARLRLDLVLNDFVAGALANGKVEVLSDGTPWRPLIHVRDMARAIEWAIRRPADEGGPFLSVNVGADGWNFQVFELARAVGAAMPGVEVSISTKPPADNRSYRVDFSLYRTLAPDHQPLETLDGAICELRDRLQDIAFRDTDFRNSQLMRLRTLQNLVDGGVLTDSLRSAGATA